MTVGIINPWVESLNHQNLRALMGYLLSFNCESQVLAIDGTNAENIQTTGTKQAILNGVPITVAADAEMDISAQTPYTAWATSTAYTTQSEVYVADKTGEVKHYVCISAHTSGASTKPSWGADWETKWRLLKNWAVTATGDVIAQDATGHYLACVISDGTLVLFKAHDGANNIKIPAYDPTRYIPIGLISVTPTSGSYTCGTTALTTIGTFKQLTGPVFPAFDLIDF